MKLYRYCKLAENKKCRFGYPKQPAPRTEFVEDTCIYERGVQDMNMNNYNPFLLATWRANMDIQYNKGEAAVRYLAKYMAKNEAEAIVEVSNRGSGYFRMQEKKGKEHFQNRIVGAIEAVYDVMGWHKHQSSRSVMFLKTALPSDDRRLLKPDIKDIRPDSGEIFSRTHVGKEKSKKRRHSIFKETYISFLEKYEKRNGAEMLTMPQFFCFYREESQV